MDSARYAIYFSPEEGSPLERFGARWLGRSAFSAEYTHQDDFPGIDPSRRAKLTEAPRHYGFHGTLKPPFYLRNSTTESDLLAAAQEFTANRPAITCSGLVLSRLGHFLALTLRRPCNALKKLAFDCVSHFDEHRSPSSDEEITRRRKEGLTYRQELHLMRWGYPYVFRDHLFHLSLTGRIEDQNELSALQDVLKPHLNQFADDPVRVNALYIFSQPHRSEPFTVLERFALR